MVKDERELRVCLVVLNCEKVWIVVDRILRDNMFFRNMKCVEICFFKKKMLCCCLKILNCVCVF